LWPASIKFDAKRRLSLDGPAVTVEFDPHRPVAGHSGASDLIPALISGADGRSSSPAAGDQAPPTQLRNTQKSAEALGQSVPNFMRRDLLVAVRHVA
jgi:hypothetical protein